MAKVGTERTYLHALHGRLLQLIVDVLRREGKGQVRGDAIRYAKEMV
jgi:hypothetical protein